MLKKFLWAVVLGVAVYGSGVYAQEKVKVIYPDGSVRYEDPAPAAVVAAPTPAAAPAGSKTVSGVSCCPCNGGTGKCTPECKKGKNEPEVSSLCPPGTTECKDIPVVVDGSLETTTSEEKFYVSEEPYEAFVKVPAIEIKSTERCEFKRIKYKVDCCEISVCVPCQSCITKSKKCVLNTSKVKHKILVKLRRDGTYDVYVLDVPGMPKQYLVVNEGTKQDVKETTDIDLP